jgi:hypothetical protein
VNSAVAAARIEAWVRPGSRERPAPLRGAFGLVVIASTFDILKT